MNLERYQVSGCKWDSDSKTVACNVKVRDKDRTIEFGQVVLGIDNGRPIPINEGEVPDQMVLAVIKHLKDVSRR